MNAPATIEDQIRLWVPGSVLGPGIWADVPAELYHGHVSISKSGLDDIAVSPAKYRWCRDNPQPDTQATRVGRAIHCLILEPLRFAERYIRAEYAEFRTTESKAWRAAHEAAGRTVLRTNSADPVRDPPEWDYVHRVADAVRAQPVSSILLNPADLICELSCFWIDPLTGVLCKCRPDAINTAHTISIDLKSCVDATMSGFQRSVHEYRYFLQDAWYSDGMIAAGLPAEYAQMVFCAVEKDPPWHIAEYELPREWRDLGRQVYRRDLNRYAECLQTNDWPGLPVEIRVLEMPAYAQYQPIS